MIYKTLIIINPISGHRHFIHPEFYIEKGLDSSVFDYKIVPTEYVGHAYKLAQDAVKHKVDLVIVGGGDGTINEVVSALQNTSVKIGILPIGSGNGLARELGIPLRLRVAVGIINRMKTKKIDLININDDIVSVNVAGIGFDAYIAQLFNYSKKRGIWTYIKMTISEYFKYHSDYYVITKDGETIKKSAFLIALANTRQFGNNTFIAPQAMIDDSQIDICILKPFPLIKAPLIAFRLFSKTIERSNYYESLKADKIKISSNNLTTGHADGEVIKLRGSIKAKINPQAIEVIVP